MKPLSILLLCLSISCAQAAESDGFVSGVAEGDAYRASLAENTLVLQARGSLDRLTFTTANVTRGERDVSATERFEASPEGVEQSWRFATRPRGTGDLAVTVAALGLAFDRSDATGLHFREAGARHGIRYGHGTFIDASGERTAIPARYEEGRIVLRVPSAIVDAARFPAVLDPIIGPEIDVEDLVGEPAAGSQLHAGYAFDGTNFLVVWGESGRIKGSRVTPDGVALDSPALDVAGSGSGRSFPTVAFNGTHYLITWMSSSASPFNVYGRRMSPDGSLVDASDIVISDAADTQRHPQVASDGVDFFVAWEDNRSGDRDMWGARVRADGTVLDPDGLALATEAFIDQAPDLTFGGGNYFLTWWGNGGAKATRITPAGVALDVPALLVVAGGARPEASSDGTKFMVACEAPGGEIRATVVTGGGAVGASTTVHDSSVQVESASIAFDGTNFGIVWQERRTSENGIYGARVNSAGLLLDATSVVVSEGVGARSTPGLVVGAGTFLAGWNDRRTGGYDIFGARLDGAFDVTDPDGFVISFGDNAAQEGVAVGFDGTNYLVAWQDSRNESALYDLFGARFTADGVRIGDSFVIASASGNQIEPRIAFDGSNYLVVWRDSRDGDEDVFGARVSATGVVIDSSPIVIDDDPAASRNIDVAYVETRYWVVWDDPRGGLYGVYGKRVANDGSVMDASAVPISVSATSHRIDPSIAYMGGTTLVTWSDLRSGEYDVYAARVSRGGSVVDPTGIPISTAPNLQTLSQVTHDGAQFFVVWRDGSTGNPNGFKGTRVAIGGAVMDPAGILIRNSNVLEGRVAFDGSQFVTVWRSPTDDIRGARVARDGALVDAAWFPVSTLTADESEPDIGSAGDGSSMVAYASLAAGDANPDLRARIIRTDEDPNGDPCAVGSTCASGFCVDGVCCESACGGGAADDCLACAASLTSAANGSCAPVAAGSTCGDATDDVCRNPDQCDAAGACQANDEPVGTVCGGTGVECRDPDRCDAAGACAPGGNVADGSPCGSSADTVCDGADTCSGGLCELNLSVAGVVCGDTAVDCREPDVCDGAGTCTDSGFAAAGTPCGSGADSECDDPDSCDLSGTCVPNYASAGAACGDIGVECREDDACDGAGSCSDGGLAAVGTACGSSVDDECDDPDSCDAAGACAPNYASSGTACGDIGIDCREDDSCDGAGACADNGFAAVGTMCGSSADTECDNPDSCDALGGCAPNHASAGIACGDVGVPCALDDACDGVGGCMDAGFAAAGTACGDASDTACTDPDACDGGGACLANNAADGSACMTGAFCLTGDVCAAGACEEGSADACPAEEEKCSESMMMCILACGDGVLDPGEECDDGMLSDTAIDACRSDCRAARCGDGAIDTGEECDDGDLNDDGLADACRTNCLFPSCGDGVVDAGEGCDEGPDNSDAPGAICRVDCALASCGDGILDVGEGCDDGMLSDTVADACRTTCVNASCGDGVLDTGEVCDDGVENSDVAPDACRSGCEFPSCGDGVADTGEACDDGVENSDSEPDACRVDCSAPRCGDGVVDMEEACDDGEDNSNAPGAGCRVDCQMARCGDAIIDPDEECDDGADNNDELMDACRSGCVAAGCGDGVLDTGESCDEGDANSDDPDATCRSNCATASCGDGVVDDGEECDDGPANSDVIPNVCRANCVDPRCGDGIVDIDEECDGGDDCSPECSIVAVDAGTDAGIDAGDVGVDTGGGDVGGDGGCGCHVASRERPRGVWFALLLIAIVWRRAR